MSDSWYSFKKGVDNMRYKALYVVASSKLAAETLDGANNMIIMENSKLNLFIVIGILSLKKYRTNNIFIFFSLQR